jgi:hypothetical protein
MPAIVDIINPMLCTVVARVRLFVEPPDSAAISQCPEGIMSFNIIQTTKSCHEFGYIFFFWKNKRKK